MTNLEKTLLQWGSLFSIFEEGETQYQSTKDAIAAFKGAFTAINGFTIPPLDTTGIDTWVADNLSIDNFPTLNLDNIQVKIDSAISAIGAFDFSEIFDTLETKFGKIFEDLWNLITSLFPWIPEAGATEEQTTSSSTQVNNPYWSDSMNDAVNKNNNNQPEEDPITAFGNWIQGGINEHIKGWLG